MFWNNNFKNSFLSAADRNFTSRVCLYYNHDINNLLFLIKSITETRLLCIYLELKLDDCWLASDLLEKKIYSRCVCLLLAVWDWNLLPLARYTHPDGNAALCVTMIYKPASNKLSQNHVAIGNQEDCEWQRERHLHL